MFDDRLSERFIEAFGYAARLHGNLQPDDKPGDQCRKETTIPYISHPMAVASIVMEFGGSEDQVIAALLHDLVEDRGRRGATGRHQTPVWRFYSAYRRKPQ